MLLWASVVDYSEIPVNIKCLMCFIVVAFVTIFWYCNVIVFADANIFWLFKKWKKILTTHTRVASWIIWSMPYRSLFTLNWHHTVYSDMMWFVLQYAMWQLMWSCLCFAVQSIRIWLTMLVDTVTKTGNFEYVASWQSILGS